MPLFNNARHRSRIPLHYGTAKGARNTIRRLKTQPIGYAKQVVRTMMYRAVYHKHQTKGMKDAASIYRGFLRSLSSSHTRKKVS
jgi:hypothetical protein